MKEIGAGAQDANSSSSSSNNNNNNNNSACKNKQNTN